MIEFGYILSLQTLLQTYLPNILTAYTKTFSCFLLSCGNNSMVYPRTSTARLSTHRSQINWFICLMFILFHPTCSLQLWNSLKLILHYSTNLPQICQLTVAHTQAFSRRKLAHKSVRTLCVCVWVREMSRESLTHSQASPHRRNPFESSLGFI